MPQKKKFVLIDSMSIVHRAYHAYPSHLGTSKGEQTNAVYGFTAILIKVIEDLKPDLLVSVFDTQAPTIRHHKYSDYKANRDKPDNELLEQIPKVKKVLRTFDIPIFEVDGFEADDIIGTFENSEEAKNFQKVIVTGDQDIFQLVDQDTRVYLSGRTFKDSKMYDSEDVREKLGIRPDQVVDYKALCGDSSDNIPGVKGIGKVGASKLLKQFDNLENVYENIAEVPGRYRKKLQEESEQAQLSKELATIIKDVPVEFELEDAQWGEFDISSVRQLFKKFEFRSLYKKISKLQRKSDVFDDAGRSKENLQDKFDLKKLENEKDWEAFIKKVKKEKQIAFYSEIKGSIYKADLKTLGMTVDGEEIYIINDNFKNEIQNLKAILKDIKVLKIGYDIKTLIHALDNLDFNLKGTFFDVQIAAYLIQEGEGNVGFENLVFSNLGVMIEKEEALSFDFGDMKNSDEEEFAYETSLLFKLFDKQEKQLGEIGRLSHVFYEIEMPIIKILAEMERNGIKLDKKCLKKYKRKLEEKIASIEEEIYEAVGHEFNVSSPKQVSEILFEELDLPKPPKTKSGNYKTGAKILKDLEVAHPVVGFILKYRELSKLNSTYTNSLLDFVNKETGRIHSSFNQAVTSTGRLSSSNPNMQNIPISTDLGREVRKAFVAEDNYCVMAFDYSQQELRILAHLSGEKALIEAFEKDIDIHALTASKIFDKKEEDVDKDDRQIGKTINYGIIYGMSANGLASSLKISYEKASDFIDLYFEQFPSIKGYFDELIDKAKKDGYVETIHGRRRNANALNSKNYHIRQGAVREIMNFPLQGSASDIMKLAMIESIEVLKKKYKKYAKLILQIHDELVFEYKGEEKLDQFKKEISGIMEDSVDLAVRMKVDVFEARNWYNLH